MTAPDTDEHSRHAGTQDRVLTDEALRKFDADFRDWVPYARLLQASLPEPPRRIMDLGGGNGRFVDAVLELFPHAQGVLVDSAAFMIDRNRPHPRKQAFLGDAQALRRGADDEPFDLITINVLLHHLVGPTSEATWANAVRCLADLRPLLAPGGRVVLYEQVYEGRAFGPEPGELIFQLTRVRNPLAQRVFRSFGANTAGIGVRFRSREGWRRIAREAGFEVEQEATFVRDRVHPLHRYPLNIADRSTHAFVLRTVDQAPQGD